MMSWHSLRFRMSVLYSVVLGLILTLVVGVIVFQVRHILYRNFDDKLKIKAVKVANMFNTLYRMESGQEYLRIGPARIAVSRRGVSEQTQQLLKSMWKTEAEALNLGSDYIQIYNAQNELLNQSENVTPMIAQSWRASWSKDVDRIAYQDIRLNNQNCRWIHYPFAGPENQMYYVNIAGSLEKVNVFVREMLALSLTTIIIVLVITSFLGWLFAQRVLRPVNNVVDTAQKISHKDLHLRITSEDSDEEIKYLIEAFNAMIERLQTSFEHINDFSSHVAHELKTPLAIIRGEMELALQQTRDPEEYQRVMRVCLEEMDRLIRLIKGMLLLAQLDYQPQMFHFTNMDVGELLRDLSDQARIMAELKNLEFKAEIPQQPLMINADADQLRRLFLNLLDNAVKYTDSGGRIGLTVSVKDSDVCVEVSDTGHGVSAEHQKKIFDKFYRVPDRSKDIPGTGLGLSIAQSVAKAHQSRLEFKANSPQGSIFLVTIPLV